MLPAELSVPVGGTQETPRLNVMDLAVSRRYGEFELALIYFGPRRIDLDASSVGL